MGKFCQIFMELSARDMPIFLFTDDNLSKCQGILTKLGTCIDIVEIWFGIACGQISSNFDGVFCPRQGVGVNKNVKGLHQVFKTLYFLNPQMGLVYIWYNYKCWSKILLSPIHIPAHDL